MDLILWRHADASPGSPDLERPLTAKGRKQAAVVGRWLAARLPKKTRLLVSPARRARQTAQALERPYETLLDIAPGADPQALLTATGWPEADGTVLVVGHQPTLGLALGQLLGARGRDFALKKGGLVWLTRRAGDPTGQAELKAAISAEFI